jgi:Leucine-rich repeat (LRR) protein
MPQELCHLKSLEYLDFADNDLTGIIPACIAQSFPLLLALFLQNNNFSGLFPSIWNLTNVAAIVVSNNPSLVGELSDSLFHQQGTSSNWGENRRLISIVIEGTKIGGKLSHSICSVVEMSVLALSGNRLNGVLPNCLSKLQKLRTLRLASNSLQGSAAILS